MKIALVLPKDFAFDERFPNSIETVVRTLNRHSRYRDELVVLADEGPHPKGDYRFIGLPADTSRAKRTRACIRELRALAPDLLELHQHAVSAQRVARAMRAVPSIFYRHNFVRTPENAFQRFRHRHRNAAFDAHVFVSQAAVDDFVGYYPVFENRAFAIPNGIEPAFWDVPGVAREKLVAYCGRTAPEKGFGAFCGALPAVLDAHPDWRAEIFGSTWDVMAEWRDAQLKPLSRFGARVRIFPDQPFDAVPTLMARAAIAVVPTITREAFGLSAAEALAGGAALVSSGRGGLREASGPHAVYVDPPEAGALAGAIDGLIRDPDRRVTMAREGRRFVRETHSAAKRAAELDDLRETVVARRRG